MKTSTDHLRIARRPGRHDDMQPDANTVVLLVNNRRVDGARGIGPSVAQARGAKGRLR